VKKGEAILVGLIAGGALGAGVGFIIANRGANSRDGEGIRAGAVLTTLGAALSAIGGTMLLSERKLIGPTNSP
jgi:hypothetical protein